MIESKDIVNLNFLKKEACTGSFQGMRFKIEMFGDKLVACVWPGPYCSDAAPEQGKIKEEFPADQDGLDRIPEWLNLQYKEREEVYKQVRAY